MCEHANNARNRCIYSLSKAGGMLNDLDSVKETYDPTDAIIKKIDED